MSVASPLTYEIHAQTLNHAFPPLQSGDILTPGATQCQDRRHAQAFGYEGTVEEFRTALAEVKAEHFAGWSIDELSSARDEAAECCHLLRDGWGRRG